MLTIGSGFRTGPQITLGDILTWASDSPVAAAQLQKAFDWQIAQWSAFASTVLTATLGFVATVIVENLKGTLSAMDSRQSLIIAGGVSASLALYAFCHYRIGSLRRNFVELYTLLAHLK